MWPCASFDESVNGPTGDISEKPESTPTEPVPEEEGREAGEAVPNSNGPSSG